MQVKSVDNSTNFSGYVKDTELMRTAILDASKMAMSASEKELLEARRFFNTITLIKGDISDNVLKIENSQLPGVDGVRAKYGNITTWKASYGSPTGFVSAIGEKLFGKTAIEVPTVDVTRAKEMYVEVSNALNKLFKSFVG